MITNWEDYKKMASQLGLPLVPDTSYYYPRFYLGLLEGEYSGPFDRKDGTANG